MGVDPVTAGLSAITAGANIFSEHSAQSAQTDQFRLFKQLFAEGRDAISGAYGNALSSTKGYYDQVDRLLGQSGHTARTAAVQRGEQYASDATESSINRGLYGTSYLDSIKGGIASDTSRQLSSIDENLAGLMANSLRQRSSDISSLMTGQGLATANLFGDEARGLLGFQHQAGKSNLMGFAPMLQGLGGMFGGQQDWSSYFGF